MPEESGEQGQAWDKNKTKLVSGELFHGVKKRGEARRKRQKTEEIERSALNRRLIARDKVDGKNQSQNADRQIDIKQPWPTLEFEDRTCQKRSQEGRKQHWNRSVPGYSSHLLAGHAGHHELSERSQKAAGDTLNDSGGDELLHGARFGAQERGNREGRKTEEIQVFCSHAVNKPAVERKHKSESQKISADNPLCG
jgi:hypothetical protein